MFLLKEFFGSKLSSRNTLLYFLQVSKDEGIRPTTLEGLNKLKPAFKENGSTTAGELLFLVYSIFFFLASVFLFDKNIVAVNTWRD